MLFLIQRIQSYIRIQYAKSVFAAQVWQNTTTVQICDNHAELYDKY